MIICPYRPSLYSSTAAFFFFSYFVTAEQLDVETWTPAATTLDEQQGPSTTPYTSASSTNFPTHVPSRSVSLSPTFDEHSVPSDSPSSRPSSHPTISIVSATLTPSSSPTLQCHDEAPYRSPINSLNCSQHVGTDCFHWKYLGLSPEEVEILIENCPISCEISCGTLNVFDTKISFRLLNVGNYLTPESTKLFEEATSNYLTKTIHAKNSTCKFSLNNVELISQQKIEKIGGTQRSLRSLQVNEVNLVDLVVSVAFRGFVLWLSLESIETYILEEIPKYGYLRALRFTNDAAFSVVEVALDDTDNSTAADVKDDARRSDHRETSPWLISFSVLLVTALIAFVLSYTRSKRWPIKKKSLSNDIVISPAGSAGSAIVGNSSYDSIVRFAPVILAARSETPTSIGHSLDSSILNKSIMSRTSQGESFEEANHFLNDVIPPMIIYDVNDGSEELNVLNAIKLKAKTDDTVTFNNVLAMTAIPIQSQGNHHEGSKIELSEEEFVRSDNDDNTTFVHISRNESNQNCSEKDFSPSKTSDTDNHKIIVNVPRRGKLGLVVQCSAGHKPVVVQVKENSRLKRKVQAGDRILCIDGNDTTGMTLNKITELLSCNDYDSNNCDTLSRIIIWRPQNKYNEANESFADERNFKESSENNERFVIHQRFSHRKISISPTSQIDNRHRNRRHTTHTHQYEPHSNRNHRRSNSQTSTRTTLSAPSMDQTRLYDHISVSSFSSQTGHRRSSSRDSVPTKGFKSLPPLHDYNRKSSKRSYVSRPSQESREC